jgi:hypothetical protein
VARDSGASTLLAHRAAIGIGQFYLLVWRGERLRLKCRAALLIPWQNG